MTSKRSPADAIELAYGLIWHVSVDTRTERGRCISLARLALLEQIDLAGQGRGITAARERIAKARVQTIAQMELPQETKL